jgi:ADP-heptose:LPS heptosyltransferase
MRKEPTDIYISFHHTWLLPWYLFELWLAFRSRARFLIGINPDFVGGHGVFDRAVPESLLGARHYRLFFLDVVRLLGEAGGDIATEFPLEPWDIDRAQACIRQALPNRSHVVCFHVGASHPSQLWPIDCFKELAKRLQAEGCEIVLIGTREERELTNQVAAELPEGSTLNVAGTTDLFEMAALIDASDLFVGNDSGPMHVAIARRRPTIGLIGPGKPRYHCYEPHEAVILKNPGYYDIKEHKDTFFPWRLTVEEVYEKAKGLLQ